MLVLYVAATLAEDRLILSGAVAQKELKNLAKTEREQWLAWEWQALELTEHQQSGVLAFGEDVQIQLTVGREPQIVKSSIRSFRDAEESGEVESSQPMPELLPLL